MADHTISLKRAEAMNRRVFLRTMQVATVGFTVGVHLPARQLHAEQGDTSEFQLKASEPNPKWGGTLRDGILSALAYFDVHQSGTVSNMAAQKVRGTPGMTFVDFYQSVIHGVWVNNTKKPLDDPRVQRAMHLALDKHVLVEVVKDVTPTLVGGAIYPLSEWATPSEEMSKRLGYQTDPKAAVQEARRRLA
jgi:ABC-type transport system substrate-binding protein